MYTNRIGNSQTSTIEKTQIQKQKNEQLTLGYVTVKETCKKKSRRKTKIEKDDDEMAHT